MWISSIAVTNVKSFRDRTPINFSEGLNVLVGPNAGGKSNLLDILSLVLRRYLAPPYRIYHEQQSGVLRNTIRLVQSGRPLEKHRGHEDKESVVRVEFSVRDTDVENMRAIKDHRSELEAALAQYSNPPVSTLGFVEPWDLARLAEASTIGFEVRDDTLEEPKASDPSRPIWEYLRHLELFLILSAYIPGLIIHPSFLYMSPYRGASEQDVRVRLAQDDYYQLLTESFGATSHSVTQALKLASLRFADKHRGYEWNAKDSAYGEPWAVEPDVLLVSERLEGLGYKWQMELLDRNTNTYEIALQGPHGKLSIAQASSGEVELLSFIYGVLGYNLRGGTLLIDEPELHLHPRWQGLMRDTLAQLARGSETQVIVSTHSPMFITPETLPAIRRVARNESGATVVHSVDRGEATDPRDLLHIINSHNNERMFFADKVILVEGISDRLVFEALVRHFSLSQASVEVVEVLEVHGKPNFEKYRSFLDTLEVPSAIIADLDYVADIGGDALRSLFEVDYAGIGRNVLANKRSKDAKTLACELERAIRENDREFLQEVWDFIRGRHRKLRTNLSDAQKEQLEAFLREQREQSVYILTHGELEDYLPSWARTKTLDDVIRLVKPDNFIPWLETEPSDTRVQEMCKIVRSILKIGPNGSLAACQSNEQPRSMADDPGGTPPP